MPTEGSGQQQTVTGAHSLPGAGAKRSVRGHAAGHLTSQVGGPPCTSRPGVCTERPSHTNAVHT